jgi:hypothetical protein
MVRYSVVGPIFRLITPPNPAPQTRRRMPTFMMLIHHLQFPPPRLIPETNFSTSSEQTKSRMRRRAMSRGFLRKTGILDIQMAQTVADGSSLMTAEIIMDLQHAGTRMAVFNLLGSKRCPTRSEL